MKKLASGLIACLFACTLFGCAASDEGQDGIVAKDSLEVLTQVWDNCPDSAAFPIMGGGYAAPVDGAPGAVEVSDADTLEALLVVPADAVSMLDGAASFTHAMNTNLLTAAAFHLADPNDASAFESAYKDAVMSNQWICGAPQVLVIAHLGGGYMVSIFGDEGLVESVKGGLVAAYPSAEITVEQSL